MADRMRAQGVEHLWLDATGLERVRRPLPDHRRLAGRHRARSGRRDWLPIAPAAHYLSGGVVTDLWGATALPGLWAAGEVACTGVHGANRLASNSLLEGMVFGARLAEAILAGRRRAHRHRACWRPVLDGPGRAGAGTLGGCRSARIAGAAAGVGGRRRRSWPDVAKARDRSSGP